jgi:hypothetical protein
MEKQTPKQEIEKRFELIDWSFQEQDAAINAILEYLEEEKRKAFEAARERCYAKRNPLNYPSEQTYPTYEDYLNQFAISGN